MSPRFYSFPPICLSSFHGLIGRKDDPPISEARTQDLPDEAPNSLASLACWPRPQWPWVCLLPFPQGPKLTVKNRCPFWGSDFSHPFWDTPTQSEPLEADASWWTKSAWDQDPVCNLWHVVDMRSGINLFDLSSCFGNTLHCITSEKSVKAFAGCKWILELAWAFHELVHCTHAYNCKELM